MASSYPGAIDSFTNPTSTDTLDSATVPHATQHTKANDAIKAVEIELGVNPSGSYSTVASRFSAVDSAIAGVTSYTMLERVDLRDYDGADHVLFGDIRQDYRSLILTVENFATDNSGGMELFLRCNEDDSHFYSTGGSSLDREARIQFAQTDQRSYNISVLTLPNYSSTTAWKIGSLQAYATDYNGGINSMNNTFTFTSRRSIDSLLITFLGNAKFQGGGKIELWGVK